MTKAFVVTSGEYSDYGVECVFETRTDAIIYCAARNGISVADQTYLAEVDAASGRDWHKLSSEERYRDLQRKLRYDSSRVEEFDYYRAGEVPTAEAKA